MMGPTPMGDRGRGGKRAPMAEINVTPLVDVMLVLLIIFMVAAPLLVAGVPVNLPDSRAKALEQDKKPVEVSIDGNGQIYIDADAVPMNDLPRRFTASSVAVEIDTVACGTYGPQGGGAAYQTIVCVAYRA